MVEHFRTKQKCSIRNCLTPNRNPFMVKKLDIEEGWSAAKKLTALITGLTALFGLFAAMIIVGTRCNEFRKSGIDVEIAANQLNNTNQTSKQDQGNKDPKESKTSGTTPTPSPKPKTSAPKPNEVTETPPKKEDPAPRKPVLVPENVTYPKPFLVDGFTVEIKSAILDKDSLACELLLTNSKPDVKLMGKKAELYFGVGKSKSSAKLDLGSKPFVSNFISLPKDTPLLLVATFRGVPEDLKKVTRLEIHYKITGQVYDRHFSVIDLPVQIRTFE